jgi:hypothetical protein
VSFGYLRTWQSDSLLCHLADRYTYPEVQLFLVGRRSEFYSCRDVLSRLSTSLVLSVLRMPSLLLVAEQIEPVITGVFVV